MSFNLISIAILFIAAVIITFEVIRALSRGVKKSVVTLVSVFISMFVAIVITFITADSVIASAMTIVDRISGIDILYDRFPHFKDVASAYVDAIISPILFVLLFVLIRVIVAIVFAIVFRRREKRNGNREYENEDAPDYKKKPKLISATLGVVSGFLVSMILFMPIVGTLKTAATATRKLNETSEAFNFRIKGSLVKSLDKLSNDLVGNVFYYSGGILLYKSTATSRLNENHFELESEIVNSLDGIDDLLKIGTIISDIEAAKMKDENYKDVLRNVGKKINRAETLKTVGADFISDLAWKWLNHEQYYNIPKPKVGNACEVFFDKMLFVCKSTTPDAVGDDLSTLLNVFLISDECEILNCDDYKVMLETSNRTGAFNQIKAELEKNSRMRGVSLEIDNMAVRAVASAINNFSPEDYDAITADVANTLNEALKLKDREERVEYITTYMEYHINEREIDVGRDITGEVAEKLSEELLDTTHEVTSDEVKEFWDRYTLTEGQNASN